MVAPLLDVVWPSFPHVQRMAFVYSVHDKEGNVKAVSMRIFYTAEGLWIGMGDVERDGKIERVECTPKASVEAALEALIVKLGIVNASA